MTISIDKLNQTLAEINLESKLASLVQVGDTAIANRTTLEGSTLGLKISKIAGGFQSLTITTDEGETVTVEPTVALMTNAIDGGGIKVTRTSGNKSEITTLTGKTTADGFLTVAVTQGSPKGLEKTIAATASSNPEAIKKKMKQVSSSPETVEVLKINTDTAREVTNDLEKVINRNRYEVGNPYGSLSNPFSGAAGLPFANILGNAAGLLKSVLRKTSASNATTKNLSQLTYNVPSSSTPVEIIKSDGSTNLTEILDNVLFTLSDVPFVVGESPVAWAGSNTSESEYKNVFTNVDKVEELETEIRKAFKFRPFTALLVSSSNTGLNQDLDAATIHKKDTEYVRTILPASQLSSFGGIQTHYVIRRDGTIQRGRPLRVPLYAGSGLHGWAKRTVSVMFIGGVNSLAPFEDGAATAYSSDSYTTKQWESFGILCKAFRAAVPGGEALTIDEYSGTEKPNAHFSARDWTNTKFGWETQYVGNNDLKNRWDRNLGPMQLDEISKHLPEKVAKATSSLNKTKPAVPKPAVQEKTDAEKEADQRSIINTQKNIDKNESRILQLENELATLRGDPIANASRILEISAQIVDLKLENFNAEKTLENLRVNRHDSVTYNQTLFNQAQAVYRDEGTAAARASLKQAETAVRQAVKSQQKENER